MSLGASTSWQVFRDLLGSSYGPHWGPARASCGSLGDLAAFRGTPAYKSPRECAYEGRCIRDVTSTSTGIAIVI